MRIQGRKGQILIPDCVSGSERLIHELKERQYIVKALPALRKNLRACSRALEQLELYDTAKLEKALPLYYGGLDYWEFLLDGDINPADWAARSYARNTVHPESLIYESEGGLLTRSKAESEIATVLEREQIVFRYEPRLLLGKHCYYPDFCAVHPVHRKQIFWEHFGKMDDPEYAADAMEKLRVYAQWGYKLGDNLIMTWETKAFPLTFKHIKERVDTYFS
ncbi:hypothetical protein NE619_08400 [Anaerovorax odorimutans]|uniref:Uncharacterized protein n=1 Tax=Anaerovorax odorimutans TaxID=109327 RepID=A0ABT1RNJ0_9FIRM|nr:hypothetical protein [Anaerovorax odorimutans]MCQ4636749.1 hypothetical protein [Anaerovorax odorimutans]